MNNVQSSKEARCAVSMRGKLANACLRNLHTRRIHAFLYLFNKEIPLLGLFFFVMRKAVSWIILENDLKRCFNYCIHKNLFKLK